MKPIVLFILILQAYFTVFASAQTPRPVQFGKLIFQANGEFAYHGGTGKPDSPEAVASEALSVAKFRELRASNVHPFKWQDVAPPGITYIFPISGNLKDIYKALNEFGGKAAPAWVWNDISDSIPLTIKIYLYSTGIGYIKLYQSEQLVGYLPCMSGLRSKQPHEGNWSVNYIGDENDPQGKGEKGRKSNKWNSWMSWAVGTNNTNAGCYIHGGSLESESDGCVRLPRPGAHIIYELVKKGTKVVITHL